jgi:hypothetical protein
MSFKAGKLLIYRTGDILKKIESEAAISPVISVTKKN